VKKVPSESFEPSTSHQIGQSDSKERHKEAKSKKRVSGMATNSMDEFPMTMDPNSRSPPNKERRHSLLPGPFQKKLPGPSYPGSVTDSPSKKIFMRGSRSNYDLEEGGDSHSESGHPKIGSNASFDKMSLHDEPGVKPKGSPPFLKEKLEKIGVDSFGRRRSLTTGQDDGKALTNRLTESVKAVITDVDFVLNQLKAFEESEKKMVESLNRLFHVCI
jgi:hypothetical protein